MDKCRQIILSTNAFGDAVQIHAVSNCKFSDKTFHRDKSSTFLDHRIGRKTIKSINYT